MAYPYEDYWVTRRDPETNIEYGAFDRAAFDAAQPEPGEKTFRTIMLENEYLKLTFIPELGGRLYQVVYKPTGQSLLYNNAVLKPSPWGMPEQGGWLAAGGMEWAFPTQEHGYEWNLPWDAQVTTMTDGISVTLTDSTATDRPRVQVNVTLPSKSAYFTVSPRIENPTDEPQRIQFWLNAMLNPGSNGPVSPDTEFVLPDDSVWIHSTGNQWISEDAVPASDATSTSLPVTFSELEGRDMRLYSNWDEYLGIFAVDPSNGDLAENFVGAYNHSTAFGVARVFPPAQAPGVKLFAFGPNFCCSDAYKDDESEYFELWGGIPRTFFPDDDVTLAPGEVRTWTENWLLLPKTGGLSAAAKDAALNLRESADSVYLSVYSPIARRATVVLKQGDTIVEQWQMDFGIGQVWEQNVKTELQNLKLELQTPDGKVIVGTP